MYMNVTSYNSVYIVNTTCKSVIEVHQVYIYIYVHVYSHTSVSGESRVWLYMLQQVNNYSWKCNINVTLIIAR